MIAAAIDIADDFDAVGQLDLGIGTDGCRIAAAENVASDNGLVFDLHFCIAIDCSCIATTKDIATHSTGIGYGLAVGTNGHVGCAGDCCSGAESATENVLVDGAFDDIHLGVA